MAEATIEETEADMVDEAPFWPAVRQAAAIRAKQLSSRELLQAYLDRIDRFDGPINAVVTLAADEAMDAARRADEQTVAAGADADGLGPLHGLPVTIKDALETAGLRSTGGAPALRAHVPAQDAASVAALRATGAIVFGKTNLPAWSGDVQTAHGLFGTTGNPWDPTRTAGGSSGGPAAAVSAAFTSFELGTDLGGSIRIPSHFCGVWGHKPTYGVVSTLGYLDMPAGGGIQADVNCVGPIARSVDDLSLALEVLLRGAPDERWGGGALPAARADRPESLRVAAWLDDERCPVERSVAAVLSHAVDALEAAGVAVDRNARPDLDPGEAASLGTKLILPYVYLNATEEDLQFIRDRTGGRFEPVVSASDWYRLQARRDELRRVWARFFERFDVLLCPVSPFAAFPHVLGTPPPRNMFVETLEVDGTTRPLGHVAWWTPLTGAYHLPVTATPVGRTAAGLPVGLQVVGARLADRTTLAFARLLAQVSGGGYEVPPAVAAGGPSGPSR